MVSTSQEHEPKSLHMSTSTDVTDRNLYRYRLMNRQTFIKITMFSILFPKSEKKILPGKNGNLVMFETESSSRWYNVY